MKRQTVIILINPGYPPQAWGNLKKLCISKGWKYNTLSKIKEIPIDHDGYYIYRVPFF
jgi:hypothetical protein